MKIAHVVPARFGPDGLVGGAERYAFELARHMADVVPTVLVTFGEADRRERACALDIRVLGNPTYVRGQRANPFSLRLFSALGDSTVVHCHQQHVFASSAIAAWCRATRRGVVVSDLGGGGWDISAYISTDRWFHSHLHLSAYSRHVFGHGDLPRARVIGGGVDITMFSPDPSVRRGTDVLFVGRLLPHKGVVDLIRALPPEMSLTIVGPAPDPDTKASLLSHAHGKSVTFKHGLDDRALVDEYRRALCIVLPSVYRTDDGRQTLVPELLGQTLLEGMACETPAICTSVASLPEVVSDGITGFVVPPNNPGALSEKLTWLRTHPDLARQMGIDGRRRVLERFTWPLVIDRCLDAYRDASSRMDATRENSQRRLSKSHV